MNSDLDRADQDQAVHRLFRASMDQEPAAPRLHDQLMASRRGLARRRRTFVVASGAVLTVLALMPAVAGQVGRNRQVPERPAELTEAAMISTCRGGDQSSAATQALFGSGTPEVKVHGVAAEMMRVVLVSADGKYWAECFINLYDGAETTAGMDVYSTTRGPNTSGTQYTSGYTCKDLDGPPAPPCSTFMVLYVGRVTEPVAAVAFDTIDGRTTTVKPVDGFVLYAYTGDVPHDYTSGDPQVGQTPRWLERITYLAEDGTRLAALEQGSVPYEQRLVDGLPSIRAYTEGFGEAIEDACTARSFRQFGLTPIECLDAADLADMSPAARSRTEKMLTGAPGHISVMVEGDVTDDHSMLRRCRGQVPLDTGPLGPNGSTLHPLICNSLELMASGAIPTGRHYRETELRELPSTSD